MASIAATVDITISTARGIAALLDACTFAGKIAAEQPSNDDAKKLVDSLAAAVGEITADIRTQEEPNRCSDTSRS